MIHGLLDASQVLKTLHLEGGHYEVYTEAEATHDRRSHLLRVTLKAFLRALDTDHQGEIRIPEWLPPSETVLEYVEPREAHEMASDIFASWNHRIAARIPEGTVSSQPLA